MPTAIANPCGTVLCAVCSLLQLKQSLNCYKYIIYRGIKTVVTKIWAKEVIRGTAYRGVALHA